MSPSVTGRFDALERLHRGFRELSEDLETLGFEPRSLKQMALVLTTQCNLRCAYCYADRKHGRTMPWSIIRAALDLMHRRGVTGSRITLYGGEPMLHPATVRRIVDDTHRLWPRGTEPTIVLCTNGTLLDEPVLRWLVEHDVEIQLSSDGIAEAQSHRGSGTFQILDRLLDLMVHHYPEWMRRRLRVKLTLTAVNLPFLASSIRYLVDAGAHRVDVVPLETHDPDWRAASARLLDEQLDAVRRLCLERVRGDGSTPCSLFTLAPSDSARSAGRSGMCGFGQGTELVVDVDGSLVACAACIPSFQSDRGPLHRQLLGNALIGSILTMDERSLISELGARRALSPPVLDRSNKKSRIGRCRDCEHFTSCFVCPASITHIPDNEDPHRIPDNQCDFNFLVARQRKIFEVEAEGSPGSRTDPGGNTGAAATTPS